MDERPSKRFPACKCREKYFLSQVFRIGHAPAQAVAETINPVAMLLIKSREAGPVVSFQSLALTLIVTEKDDFVGDRQDYFAGLGRPHQE